MQNLSEYEIHISGIPHTIQYDDAEAERLGLEKKAQTPKNKAVTPSNKRG